MEFILRLFKSFLLSINESNEQNFSCKYCKQKITNGYRYRCLECYNYELCNDCFFKRKSNDSHKTSHKMVRFSDKSNNIFGVEFLDYELYLDKLKDNFKNEIHQHVKCKICETEPIKGLRFKCSCCYDYNLCENCCDKAQNNHFKWHPLLTYGKTVSYEINFDEVQMQQDLGEGAFGKVCKATFRNQTVACKIIEAKRVMFLGIKIDNYNQQLTSYKRELDGYKEIVADNILKMIGHCSVRTPSGENFIILTEFMERGSLESIIKNEPELSYRKRFSIATGIARGMEIIHKIGFIHRDIRPANILISKDYTPKIGDMGIARVYDENSNLTQIGPINYMPPEFYDKTYTQKLDIYTFGLTVNELFFGSHIQAGRKISIKNEGKVLYRTLISKYIDDDQTKRPTSKEVNHMLTFIDLFISNKLHGYNEYWANSSSIEQRNQIFANLYLESLIEYDKKLKEEKEEKNKITREKLKKSYFKKLKIHELFKNTDEDSMVPFFLRKISAIYWQENDVDNAIKYAQMAIDKKIELVKNENHYDVIKFKIYLALLYLKLANDPQKAIEIYKHCLEQIENKDSEHVDPNVAVIYFRVGECYQKINNFDDSLKYHLECLKQCRNFYDSNSQHIFRSIVEIKECYLKLDDMNNYFKYRKEEMKIKRELYKLKHPTKEYYDVFLVRGKDNGKPAWHYVQIEDEEKYESLKKQKAGTNVDVADYGKIIESGFGENPPSYVSLLIENIFDYDFPQYKRFKIEGKSILDEYLQEENEDPMLNNFYSDLKISYEFFNDEFNYDVAFSLLNISRHYLNELNDFNNSVLLAEKCIQICHRFATDSKLKLKSEKLIADSLNIIGNCHLYITKDYNQAIDYLSKALNKRIELYPNSNMKIAFSYQSIGLAYYEKKEYAAALKNFLLSYGIFEKNYENMNNSNVCEILRKIRNTYEKMEDMENYFKYRKELLKIEKALFKMRHPDREYYDVFLVRGKDNGKPAWHYIQIDDEEKYESLKKQKAGTNIDVADYGKVIKSGWGINPPNDILKEIENNYGYEPNDD